MGTSVSTARRRRRRALEITAAAAVIVIAGWSGAMVKRSVSAPPAMQSVRVADPVLRVAPGVSIGPSGARDALPSVLASPESALQRIGSASNDAAPDGSVELPGAWRDVIDDLRDRGVIKGEVQIETIDPLPGNVRYFDGRAVRPVRRLWMTVTAYSPDERSCGVWADGITASNKSVWTNAMQLVAADTRILPFGTLLSMDDYAGGEIVPVLDRGGAIKGMRLDVLYATHAEARRFGVKRVPVTVWEYTDE